MSGFTDRERDVLAEIERGIVAADARLAQRLESPGWFDRWRWGIHREHLHALLIVMALSLVPAFVALTQ
jgi:Protein of unknown function (DUF3040)